MFKEFALIIVGFVVLFIILRRLYRRNLSLVCKVLVGLLLLSVLLNTWYNFTHIIPNYKYENVSLGDSKENLFTYKDDSEFQWQIIFPIIKERKIYLDDSNNDYAKFFGLFAKDIERIKIEPMIREKIEDEEFTTNIRMTLVDLLNYAFEPYDSTLYEDSYPFLRIHLESLKGDDELIAIVDEHKNLYLISKRFYDAEEAKQNEK